MLYLSIPFSMAVGWSPGFYGVGTWVRSCSGVAACGALTAFPSSLSRTSLPLAIPFVKRLIKSFANFLLVCLSQIYKRVFCVVFDI